MRSDTTSLDDYVPESDTAVPAAALARAVPYMADPARTSYSSSALYRTKPPQGSNKSLYAKFPSTSAYDQHGGGYQPTPMPYAAAEQAIASYAAAKQSYLG
ncbi:MAG TPA: hypothetical protein VJG90_04530 [Candidatus Nanoarchaeia archaeon]|nr:hypothetical protein [Candidatus Nanoarchaeia archaeon]